MSFLFISLPETARFGFESTSRLGCWPYQYSLQSRRLLTFRRARDHPDGDERCLRVTPRMLSMVYAKWCYCDLRYFYSSLRTKAHIAMVMTPRLRKLTLTAHVVSSVGWLGAVACSLALAIAGLTSRDAQMVRAAYLAMVLTAWSVIVPLSLASPLSGIVQSLGTPWGLFRHYWILVKFLITIPATVILLLHMQPIGHLARVVAETTLASGDLAGQRIKLVTSAGAALLVLLVATALSVFKPWGMTPYERRRQHGPLQSWVGSLTLRQYGEGMFYSPRF